MKAGSNMFLHIGDNILLAKKDIIAILNWETERERNSNMFFFKSIIFMKSNIVSNYGVIGIKNNRLKRILWNFGLSKLTIRQNLKIAKKCLPSKAILKTYYIGMNV